jgi:hypothetical protein
LLTRLRKRDLRRRQYKGAAWRHSSRMNRDSRNARSTGIRATWHYKTAKF